MDNKARVIELQIKLIELSGEVAKLNFETNKYMNQESIFTPFNKEFKDIINRIPNSFYLQNGNDEKLLNEINAFIRKINLKIESIKITNS